MTSIRLTKTVKDKILFKVETLYSQKEDKVRNSLRNDFWDEVVEEYIAEHITPHMQDFIFPAKWMKVTSTLDYKAANGTWLFSTTLNKSYTLPHLYSIFSGSSLRIEHAEMHRVLKREYEDYLDRREKIKKEKIEFKNELRKVLDNCNTLSQFLKVWPQGNELIKDMNLETEPKKPRVKRNVEIEESTINNLNSKLLKQTMLNSN